MFYPFPLEMVTPLVKSLCLGFYSLYYFDRPFPMILSIILIYVFKIPCILESLLSLPLITFLGLL